MQKHLTFEHPLNERIRTFLRAEHLFELAKHRFQHAESVWDAKDCVATIIEIYNLIERTEFRGELIKEIERHTHNLQKLSTTPNIDQKALTRALTELENAGEAIKSFSAKQGYFPTESEILNSLRQRLSIPGGTCSFDVPAFHYWLHLSPKLRQMNLSQWTEMLSPMEKALSLVLSLTRESNIPQREVANSGIFHKTLGPHSNHQLIRVKLLSDLGIFPEISASKHRINIRFLSAKLEGKSALSTQDIPFELTYCVI